MLPTALRTINEAYIQSKCWMTYGSFVGKWSEQTCDIDRDAASFDFKRESWRYAHPRTFKNHLASRYRPEDFQDAEGRWLTKCTDRLLVYHALEWSGRDRVAYISTPLYFYREHAQNSYKTVATADKARQMAHIMAQPSKACLESTIHVVMCCWERVHFLPKQLQSLNQQTLSGRLHLHLLNNNVRAISDMERVVGSARPQLHFPVTLRHYRNASFGFERFLYVRDHLMRQELLDYVVIVDDDQLFEKDWVERLWNLRTPRTYLAWYCKAWDPSRSLDYWKGSLVTYTQCRRGLAMDKVMNYHYGGSGGSLVDAAIFLATSALFRTSACALPVLNIEDLWLSFIMTHCYGWSIRRSNVLPLIPSEGREALESVALYKRLRPNKNALLRHLMVDLRWKLT